MKMDRKRSTTKYIYIYRQWFGRGIQNTSAKVQGSSFKNGVAISLDLSAVNIQIPASPWNYL